MAERGHGVEMHKLINKKQKQYQLVRKELGEMELKGFLGSIDKKLVRQQCNVESDIYHAENTNLELAWPEQMLNDIVAGKVIVATDTAMKHDVLVSHWIAIDSQNNTEMSKGVLLTM